MRLSSSPVRRWFPALLIVAAVSFGFIARKPAGSAAEAYRTISPSNVYEYCRALAAPDFSGRLTGDAGYTAAARWAAGRFEQWGLEPVGELGGYLQSFPTEFTTVEEAVMTLSVPSREGAPRKIRLEPGPDFLPLLFSDSGERTGRVVFVGWGISAPELGYDDYAGVDVRGAFALCFRGTPDPSDSRYMDHDQHRTRMRTAKGKGALGIVYIYDEPIANPNGDWISGFLPSVISAKTADRILKEKGISNAELREDLLRYRRPLSFATRAEIHTRVRVNHVPQGTGYNVVGWIEGSDPVLKKEYVVVGAHADHCGTVGSLLFPGANDNASGTAAAMAIGRAFAGLEKKPRRSILISLFGGEEMGLKGSEYLAAHLPAGLGKAVAMLNFDMVGEGDGARCGYSADPPELKTILEEADEPLGILKGSRVMREVGVRGSDFAPFLQRGIPSVSFSSNGPHLSYHQTGDTIYRINPDIMADIARLGFLAAYRLADR